MNRIQVGIGQFFPINLILLANGTLAFIRVMEFKGIVDLPTNENYPEASFWRDGFQIGDEVYEYNMAYPYKEMPVMLEWLKQQNMCM